MSDLVVVNGALVDRRYIYATIAWGVAVLITWCFTIVACRRAYYSYKRSAGRVKDYAVYWTHLGVNAVLLTIVAIDPANIFFDFTGTVNLICLLELTMGNYASVIYTFVNTVQHYIVQQKLVAPPWVGKFKRRFLWFNFISSNILIIIQVAADRVYLSGLATMYLVLEGGLIGPVFAVLVRRLTMRLEAQFATRSSAESIQSEKHDRILKGVRKFRRFAYVTTFITLVLLFLIWLIYIPRFFSPKDILHSNSEAFPDFARTRRFKTTFKFNWVMWVSPTTNAYLMYRHWIAKSSFAGSLGSSNKSGNKSGSTDSNGSAGDSYYRSSEGTVTISTTQMKGSPPSMQRSNSVTPRNPAAPRSTSAQASMWAQPPGKSRKLSTASSQASVWAQPTRQIWAHQPAYTATTPVTSVAQPMPPSYPKPVANANIAVTPTSTNDESPWSAVAVDSRERSTSMPRHNVSGGALAGRIPRSVTVAVGSPSAHHRRAADLAANTWTMRTADTPYDA